MTNQQYLFNGTNGVALTTGNSGASSLQAGSGGSTALFSTTAAWEGSTGVAFTSSGSNTASGKFPFAGGATPTQATFIVRFIIPASTPSANQIFLQVNDTTGARVLQLLYSSSGNIRINDKGNTQNTLLTPVQATPGTSFRFELVVSSLSATTGAYQAKAFSTGSTQVGSTLSISNANNGGGTAMLEAQIGVLVGLAATSLMDDLQMADGSLTQTGDVVINTTPPTNNSISANQTTTANTSVNVSSSWTAAGGSAGIASYQWSFVSALDNLGAPITGVTIANATSANASFTTKAGTAAARYILQVTATDLEGNTSAPVTTRVFVPGTTNIGFLEVTSATAWGTTNIAGLNDELDSTYSESGAPGSGGVLTARLAPLQAATSGFTLAIRALATVVAGTQKVALLEGATVRKDWGTVTLTTSMADLTPLTLTSGEMATITSWNELDIRFTQV